jgi:hypothetical protein
VPKFPTTAWFDDVRQVFNGYESYQGAGGGQCNCTAGIKIGDRAFILTFEGEECTRAVEVDDASLQDVDFYLDMPADDWRNMVKDIAANGGATLHYTLNTLDLDRDDGLAHSRHNDQYREDLFFRYNQTFQFFFDASARVKTTY